MNKKKDQLLIVGHHINIPRFTDRILENKKYILLSDISRAYIEIYFGVLKFYTRRKEVSSLKEIFTKYITLRNGQKFYASQVGKDAFRFEVTDKEYEEYQNKNKD